MKDVLLYFDEAEIRSSGIKWKVMTKHHELFFVLSWITSGFLGRL